MMHVLNGCDAVGGLARKMQCRPAKDEKLVPSGAEPMLISDALKAFRDDEFNRAVWSLVTSEAVAGEEFDAGGLNDADDASDYSAPDSLPPLGPRLACSLASPVS